MAAHNFNFEGGDILTGMGATWFVSYAYYQNVDRTHRSWDKVATTQPRISKYNKGKEYHKIWLEYVLQMSDVNLSKNTIGLLPKETKNMAKKILEVLK